jgi:hypothetical protein
MLLVEQISELHVGALVRGYWAGVSVNKAPRATRSRLRLGNVQHYPNRRKFILWLIAVRSWAVFHARIDDF